MRFPLDARGAGSRRISVPSPGLILASLALLGVMVGPAWAAGLLTGDDIKNGTVTGKDVKDGSLGPSDISRTGRAALQGTAGPTGSSGPTGSAGPRGELGPGGAAGPAGPTGPSGPAGQQGEAGGAGERGPQGEAGRDAMALWAQVTDAAASGTPTPSIEGNALDATSPLTVHNNGRNAVYVIAFDRDVSRCAALVTRRSDLGAQPPGEEPVLLSDLDAEAGGTAYAYADPTVATRIRVRLLDRGGLGTEGSFALVLRCPEPAAAQ